MNPPLPPVSKTHLFDDLCRACERYPELEWLKSWLDDAHIFRFDSGELMAAKEPSGEQAFVLPFPTTAITVAGSENYAISMWRGTGDWFQEPGYEYLSAFKALTAVSPEVFDFIPRPTSVEMIILYRSRCRILQEDGQWQMQSNYESPQMIIEGRLLDLEPCLKPAFHWSLQEDLAGGAASSALHVATISDPEKFILESKPRFCKERQRLKRRHERPEYIIANPGQIRARMHLQNPMRGEGKKQPHERSAHYRTYQNDRYIHMKGVRVRIESTWIGDKESIVGHRQYRVVTGALGLPQNPTPTRQPEMTQAQSTPKPQVSWEEMLKNVRKQNS